MHNMPAVNVDYYDDRGGYVEMGTYPVMRNDDNDHDVEILDNEHLEPHQEGNDDNHYYRDPRVRRGIARGDEEWRMMPHDELFSNLVDDFRRLFGGFGEFGAEVGPKALPPAIPELYDRESDREYRDVPSIMHDMVPFIGAMAGESILRGMMDAIDEVHNQVQKQQEQEQDQGQGHPHIYRYSQQSTFSSHRDQDGNLVEQRTVKYGDGRMEEYRVVRDRNGRVIEEMGDEQLGVGNDNRRNQGLVDWDVYADAKLLPPVGPNQKDTYLENHGVLDSWVGSLRQWWKHSGNA